MKEINMAWGYPIVIREALCRSLGIKRILVETSQTLADIEYTPHFGNPKLIEQLKALSSRHSGRKPPKHLVVTCGATGAVNAALHALKSDRTYWVTTEKRYYPMYPAVIAMTGMDMIDQVKKSQLLVPGTGLAESNFISLSASPSNPEGLVCPFESVDIWDAAYASTVYSNSLCAPSNYKIMCGSLAKSLGLAGLRLGWAATDDDLLYEKMCQYVTASYVGLSSLSMDMAEKVLDRLDHFDFEFRGRGYLDDNRFQVQKILDKFGQGNLPVRGMFAILQLGKAEKRALEKANVKWQPGTSWGEDENWARLSLGQSRELTKQAVKAVLK